MLGCCHAPVRVQDRAAGLLAGHRVVVDRGDGALLERRVEAADGDDDARRLEARARPHVPAEAEAILLFDLLHAHF